MSRPALLWLACVSAIQGIGKLSVENARDVTSDRRVFVQTSAPQESYYVHELLPLRIRIGVEAKFLKTEMVQPFAQPLDLPVQLQAPWLDAPVGAIAIDGTRRASGGAHTTFALNDSVTASTQVAEALDAGARFALLDFERTYAPTAAGELVIPAPIVRFAYATRFEDDALNGRTAKDRVDAFVRGRPLALEILPLPEQGRPPEFGGAVGRFSIDADVSSREPAVGQSFKLTLRIEGDGDLEHFDAPRVALEGFRTLGTLESLDASRRVITYDLAPSSMNVREIPPIAFAYFDPHPPAGYRVARTRSIRIDVSGPGAADRTARPPATSGESERRAPSALWIGVIGALLAAIGIALRSRARSRDARASRRAQK